MLRFLPDRLTTRWLYWGIVYTLILWGLLLVARIAVAGGALSLMFTLRFLLLAVILSVIVNISGWLGARIIWLCSTIGIAAGLIMMVLASREPTGWQDLVSFLTFLLLTVIGVGSGIVLEASVALYRSFRQPSQTPDNE